MLTARHVSPRPRWIRAEGHWCVRRGIHRRRDGLRAIDAPARAFSGSSQARLVEASLHGLGETGCQKSSTDGDKKRRNVKKVSHTPLILNALARRGRIDAQTRVRPGKINFQYTSPFKYATSRSLGRESLPRGNVAWRDARLASPNVSHKSILAHYLEGFLGLDLEHGSQWQQEQWTQQLEKIFDDHAIKCLESTGFQPEDIVRWGWVLTANTSEEAAKRLHAISNRPLSQDEAASPTFLLQLTLLRPIVSARALRLLLVHSSDRLTNTLADDWKDDIVSNRFNIEHRISNDSKSQVTSQNTPLINRRPYPGLTDTAVVTLTIRLIRHARRVWPKGLPYIARLFTQHVTGRSHRKPIQQAQLSFVYNKILYLLSLPSSQHFTHVMHHQEAQFIIIRAMNEFEPPLLVDRLGYRAVVSVQLAHPKTSKEIQWAGQKAKSWPPWQEHRLGLDENTDMNIGVTRAGVALSQLAESGYGGTSWEDAAAILSGWDTDSSPTIQMRRLFPATQFETLDLTNRANEVVWSTRISATRTVEEAWAVFLSCQDAGYDSEEAYVAVAEKLLAKSQEHAPEEPLFERTIGAAHQLLPGDNPEPFEAPRNPRKRPYLRSPVPSPDQLLKIAENRGINPGAQLLTCVLERSCPYDRGRRLIEQSSLPSEAKRMVLGLAKLKSDTLQKIDKRVLLAILRWCATGFSPEAVAMLGNQDDSMPASQPLTEDRARQVVTAFRIVSLLQPKYPPAWTPLFRALTPPAQKRRHLLLAKTAFSKMVDVISDMEKLEIERTWGQFAYLCRTNSLARIAIFEVDMSSQHEGAGNTTSQRSDVSSTILTREFEKLVGTCLTPVITDPVEGNEHSTRARNANAVGVAPVDLLRVPKPHELYMLIQSLGLAQDYERILKLTQWIQVNWGNLKERQEYSITGRKLRRCFIAIRAFLEDNRQSNGEKDLGPSALDNETINIAHRIIVDIGGEEAWPTDQEVATYQRHDLPPLWPRT